MISSHLRTLRAAPTFALLTSILALAVAQNATAATTIGDSLDGDPVGNSTGLRYAPVRNEDGSDYGGSPVAGVLTSVTVETTGSSGTVQVPLLRPAGPLGANVDYLRFAENIQVPVTMDLNVAGHQTTVTTRVSILAGDRLGLDNVDAGLFAMQQLTGGSQNCGFYPLSSPQPVGATVTYNAGSCNSWWPSVQGVVEPDADGDKFGDETQDLCPTDPTRQTACAVQSPLMAPNLVISAVKSKARPGSTATRRFQITNVGGRIASPVTIKVVSSKKVRRIKYPGTLAQILPGGGSAVLKVIVTPKKAVSTTLTVTVATPGEFATVENWATARVKFKLKK